MNQLLNIVNPGSTLMIQFVSSHESIDYDVCDNPVSYNRDPFPVSSVTGLPLQAWKGVSLQ